MPFWGKRKDNNKENDEVFLRRQCKYIGSFAVVLNKVEDRQRYVNEKLLEFKNAKKGIRVIIRVTDEGIKIFDDNEKMVKMAHAITRIAFSTCSLDAQLFSYVARSAQKSMGYNLQAHVFRCRKSIHAQELGALVSKAFRVAFTRSTMRREVLSREFEEEVAKETKDVKQGGRRWAKQEIARGHDLSEHAERARKMYGSPFEGMQGIPPEHPLAHHNSPPQLPLRDPRFQSARDRSMSDIQRRGTPMHPTPPQIRQATPPPLPDRHSTPPPLPDRHGTPPALPDRRDTPPPLPNRNPLTRTPESRHSYPSSPQLSRNHVSPLTHSFDINAELPFIPQQNSAQVEKEPVYEMPPDVVNGRTRLVHAASDAPMKVDGRNNMGESRKISAPAMLGGLVTDEELLQESEWYQGGLSREIAEEILHGELPGSFLVRDSQSQPGFYALSIRVSEEIKQDGISNYLIERLPDGSYGIMGFSRSFNSLPQLIAFYAINEADIPVRLRLSNNNPLFSVPEEDEDTDPDYEIFDSCDNILLELQRQSKK